MTERDFLTDLTGEPWTGLTFLDERPGACADVTRLCAAVGRSFAEDLTLDCAQLACLGAPRNLGRNKDDAGLAQRMAEHTGVPVAGAARILAQTPRFRTPVHFIRLGRHDDPDVLVAYLPPEAAMTLLRRWQLAHGCTLQTRLSSFMSVCSCVARAGTQEQPAFSFGCGDAREHGGLTDGRLVVALPAELVRRLRDYPAPTDRQPATGYVADNHSEVLP